MANGQSARQEKTEISSDRVVQIKNLCVTKQGQEILKNISLDIFSGDLLAIIGPNGGGKSTFMKALLHQTDYEGEIKISNDAKKSIGYVPQVLEYDKLSPISVLDFFAASLGKRPIFLGAGVAMRARVIRSLDSVEAAALIDRPLGALSGGELQRVLLALSLNPVPRLLLLDEPVSGVDQNGLDNFYALVEHMRKAHNLAIVLISHDLRLVKKHATKVALINITMQSRGTFEQVYQSAAFAEAFDVGKKHVEL